MSSGPSRWYPTGADRPSRPGNGGKGRLGRGQQRWSPETGVMQRRTERRAGPRLLVSAHFPAFVAAGLSGLPGCGQVYRKVAHPAGAASGRVMPAYGNIHFDRIGARRLSPWKKRRQGLARGGSARSRGGGRSRAWCGGAVVWMRTCSRRLAPALVGGESEHDRPSEGGVSGGLGNGGGTGDSDAINQDTKVFPVGADTECSN